MTVVQVAVLLLEVDHFTSRGAIVHFCFSELDLSIGLSSAATILVGQAAPESFIPPEATATGEPSRLPVTLGREIQTAAFPGV